LFFFVLSKKMRHPGPRDKEASWTAPIPRSPAIPSITFEYECGLRFMDIVDYFIPTTFVRLAPLTFTDTIDYRDDVSIDPSKKEIANGQ
jgi:hypothetical protein